MIASIAHIKHLYLYVRSAKPCLETVSPNIFVFGWYLDEMNLPSLFASLQLPCGAEPSRKTAISVIWHCEFISVVVLSLLKKKEYN